MMEELHVYVFLVHSYEKPNKKLLHEKNACINSRAVTD